MTTEWKCCVRALVVDRNIHIYRFVLVSTKAPTTARAYTMQYADRFRATKFVLRRLFHFVCLFVSVFLLGLVASMEMVWEREERWREWKYNVIILIDALMSKWNWLRIEENLSRITKRSKTNQLKLSIIGAIQSKRLKMNSFHRRLVQSQSQAYMAIRLILFSLIQKLIKIFFFQTTTSFAEHNVHTFGTK